MQLLVKTRVHVLLAALACIACAEPFVGIDTPADGRLYYPGRMAVSPDGSTVYIVNTNFDQRFTAGWVSVLDVNTLVNAIASGSNPNVAIDPNLMLRIPTLAGQMVLEPNGTRAYLPSRSTGLLTTIDIANNTQLSCGDDTNNAGLKYALQRTDCDANHILNFTEQAAPNISPDQFNFANYVDPVVGTLFQGNPAYGGDSNTHLAIGFLSSGYVAILDPMPSGNPNLTRMISMGNTASLSMVAADPNTAPGTVIVSNHVGLTNSLDRGVLYFVDASQSVNKNSDFVNRFNLGAMIGGFEITSLNRQGDTLYLSSNAPDAIVSIKLPQPNTFSGETVKGYVPVDSSHPTDVLYLTRPASGDLVVMPALQQDTVYFFSNDNDHLLLVQRLSLKPNGQGPFDIVKVSGKVNGQQKDYLLVTTFFDHGLSIIDISSPSYSQFEVVGTIHQGDLGVAARYR